MFPERHRPLVVALFDRLIPADDFPSFSQSGGLARLVDRAAGDDASAWTTVLEPGLDDLVVEAQAAGGLFERLPPGDQDAIIDLLHRGRARSTWHVDPTVFLDECTRIASEIYYGDDGPGRTSVGYSAAPKREPLAPIRDAVIRLTEFSRLRDSYDVLVIGAGAGGGVAARVLTEAGATVLLVDRGSWQPYSQVPRNHLANHRLSLYGHNTGPEVSGNPRVVVDDTGTERILNEPYRPEWLNNAMTIGGGTRVYQGMAWRFLPDDFRLASTYGVPDGSSLADWPITYDDLEPHYTRAEWEFGVAGDASAHPHQGRRSGGYPLPPLPQNPEARVLEKGAEALGLSTGPVPLLINTEVRDGRARCVRCGECVGFACPSDAKNGSHNTVIPLALATHRLHLADRCRAVRVTTNARGHVTGAELHDLRTGGRRTIRAGHVVVAAGAIESARLLLVSAGPAHPAGLGNATDQVGRHLQGHLYTGAFGLFDEQIQDSAGPGVSIATCDYNHTADGGIGGVLANEVVKLPILYWYWGLPDDAPRWGSAGKRAMQQMYSRTAHLFGPIQEIPIPESRVTLADDVTDALGLPVARLQVPFHPESVKAAEAHRRRAETWMQASGALRVWPDKIRMSGQHQAGTLRMGNDPRTSVTDPTGRVHGHDNLWVMDASLHVTNGGFNPVLQVLALAYHCAGHLARA